MVRAWYMDNEDLDQRLEHHRNPPQFLSQEELYKICGVEYFPVNLSTYETDGVLDELKNRGYTYEDEITCSEECLADYKEKLKAFFTEHLHTEEEVRLILEGSGYFDVRDNNDEWIRINVEPGDTIVIPSGMYHRLTLDMKNYIKVKRFFINELVWKSYNRPAGEIECRREYVQKFPPTK